jgi:hypothetical protein
LESSGDEGLHSLELVEGSRITPKGVGLDAHILQHGNEEVAERLVVIPLEGEVLAVLKAAAGEEDGKVGVVVDVGISKVAAVEDHGAVEEALSAFLFVGEVADEFPKKCHVLAVGGFELLHLFLLLPVVAEVVVGFSGRLLSGERKHRRSEGIDHQRDDPCAVGFEGKLRDAEHEVELLKEELAVVDVGWRGLCGEGLWALLPFAGGLQALLHFAHGGEVLVEAGFVHAAKRAAESPGLGIERVEDTASLFEPEELFFHVLGTALNEHLIKQSGRAILGWQQGAIARPREAAVRFLDVYAKVQRGETRHLAELFGGVLIERDAVPEAGFECTAGRSEETVVGAMSPVYAGMRKAAEHAELVPHLRKRFQVRRKRVITAIGLGKEVLGQQAKIVRDNEHALWGLRLRSFREHGGHAFEHRKSQRDAESAQEGTSGDVVRSGGDVRGVHGRRFDEAGFDAAGFDAAGFDAAGLDAAIGYRWCRRFAP